MGLRDFAAEGEKGLYHILLWYVPSAGLLPKCPLTSMSGINYESSFEAAILSRTDHCQIWGYDFSVKSFGPEIHENQIHRTHFHAFGLSGSDAHGPDDATPMYTLQTLLDMNSMWCSIRTLGLDAETSLFSHRSSAYRHFENRY
jgi:hypothetical protein